MMYPQEVEVWYVLPLIRKELAKALLNYNLTQKEIASKLGLTEAAVSQYINEKRASLATLDDNIKDVIEKSAKKIARQNANVIKEISLISSILRKNKTICKVHIQNDKSLKEDCNLCFE